MIPICTFYALVCEIAFHARLLIREIIFYALRFKKFNLIGYWTHTIITLTSLVNFLLRDYKEVWVW